MAKKITFIKGAGNISIICNVINHETGKPLPLNNFLGATAYFPHQDETSKVAVTGSLFSSDCGQVVFVPTEAQGDLFLEGEDQTFQYRVDANAQRLIAQVNEGLTVLANLTD